MILQGRKFSVFSRWLSRVLAIKKSVTLVELLIAIAIVGIISLGLTFMLTQGLKVWTGGTARTDIVDRGRIALERLSRELRQAERFTVTTWTANNIKFNVVLGGTTYIVEYKLANNSLLRSEKTSAEASDDFISLANYVNNLTFTYYNKIGSTPASANEIRTVRVNLVMDMPQPEQDVILTSEIQLRNFYTSGE
ncbi:MAG: prepilin-type N-terminal cleavage/methylation domain-containing protein [Candidatus Omnitrophica bacterium]|nr:prepilin-type N-terminal cleavage/methylation domain-containing protein [Candidatus Omnitrophota bacterium]MCM8793384.1 prepilin-type N-terminal cleavage/methylation domain-containing protein [Candidatus Omnitrophota bacterium]